MNKIIQKDRKGVQIVTKTSERRGRRRKGRRRGRRRTRWSKTLQKYTNTKHRKGWRGRRREREGEGDRANLRVGSEGVTIA